MCACAFRPQRLLTVHHNLPFSTVYHVPLLHHLIVHMLQEPTDILVLSIEQYQEVPVPQLLGLASPLVQYSSAH